MEDFKNHTYSIGKARESVTELLRNNWDKCSNEELGNLIKKHISTLSDNSEFNLSALQAYDSLQDNESKYIYHHLYLKNIPAGYWEAFMFRIISKTLKNRLVEKGKNLRAYNEYSTDFFFGKQYFDLPIVDWMSCSNNEIFIDCGAFDGWSIKGFIEFCGGKYDKIYSFEPIPSQYENTLININEAGIKRVELIQKGVWNCKGVSNFVSNGGGSRIDNEGTIPVELVSIDEVIPENEKVTFIKMDIEGAESQALQGAVNTIRRCKPKLAICIYHKPMDIIEIPILIKSILPEYKFYIRHHSPTRDETVLYALPPTNNHNRTVTSMNINKIKKHLLPSSALYRWVKKILCER